MMFIAALFFHWLEKQFLIQSYVKSYFGIKKSNKTHIFVFKFLTIIIYKQLSRGEFVWQI
jgi:hypothetical protein